MAATETPPLPVPKREAAPEPDGGAVLARLSVLDRFLPLWIALAMAFGLVLGSLAPSLNDGLDRLRIGTVSLPICGRTAADDVPRPGQGALRRTWAG